MGQRSSKSGGKKSKGAAGAATPRPSDARPSSAASPDSSAAPPPLPTYTNQLASNAAHKAIVFPVSTANTSVGGASLGATHSTRTIKADDGTPSGVHRTKAPAALSANPLVAASRPGVASPRGSKDTYHSMPIAPLASRDPSPAATPTARGARTLASIPPVDPAEIKMVQVDSPLLSNSSSDDVSPVAVARPGANLAATADTSGIGIITVSTPSGISVGTSSSSSSSSWQVPNGGQQQSTTSQRPPLSGFHSPRRDDGFAGPPHGDSVDDCLTPELLPVTTQGLRSFDAHVDLGPAMPNQQQQQQQQRQQQQQQRGAGGLLFKDATGHDGSLLQQESLDGEQVGLLAGSLTGDGNGHNGLATFFNRPKECNNCHSSAVAYSCEMCTSFYLCESCRFDEAVLDGHERGHRIAPLHETHCNTSRTFGGSSSMLTFDGASSLFYDPCNSCGKVLGDSDPVYRCDTCDFILCEGCHAEGNFSHPHELRRFQRKTRNDSVTEATLYNKSRTTDGNRIINNYVVVRLLGQGSYAKVKLVQDIRSRQLYALKILRKNRRSQSNLLSRSRSRMSDEDLLREITVMKFVSHPNIVRLTEVIEDIEAGKLYVIMEFCSKGPVHTLGSPALSLEEVRRHGLGILGGLLYLHNDFLYHRDVKPANCLVDDDDVVKIADFGTCNSRIRTSAVDGTPAFTCPDQLRGGEVSGDVADSWAFALTLYELAYGTIPCEGMGAYQYREFLLSDAPVLVPPPEAATQLAKAKSDAAKQGHSFTHRSPYSAVNDLELVDLLTRMLRKNAKERMLLAEAVHHPFFQLDEETANGLCHPATGIAADGDDDDDDNARGNKGKATGTAFTSSPSADDAIDSSLLQAADAESPLKRRQTDNPFRGSLPSDALTPISHGETRRGSGDSAAVGAGTPPTAAKANFSRLYEKALQEVRRGKNLTEAFYGVKSLRKVRRKDVKNADHNARSERDDSSVGNLTSVSLPDSATAPGHPGEDTPVKGGAVPGVHKAGRTPGTGARSIFNEKNGYSGKDAPGADDGADDGGERRVSLTSCSDAAFDLVTIEDYLQHQLDTGSRTLDLLRLRMRSAPERVNAVAAITETLRFSLNALSSVAAVDFHSFALLKDIAITSNQLRRFPEEVLQAPRLLRLDLSHNAIATVPAAVAGAKFLERLNLHGNNVASVGVDPASGNSVLAAPSLRHVRLSSNPLTALPENLASTHGVELVLDANPAVMAMWDQMVNEALATGAPPPAVVIWDDYFPVRVPSCAFDVWIASGAISIYRSYTLKVCATPYVVLLSTADPRFPRGGAFTGEQLAAYLEGGDSRRSSSGGAHHHHNHHHHHTTTSSLPQPPSRPLPRIFSKESRSYVRQYFFVADDVQDAAGGYAALLQFTLAALHRQKTVLEESGVDLSKSLSRRGKSTDETESDDDDDDAQSRPNSGEGILLALTNSSEVKETREIAVAVLTDALCKMVSGGSITDEQLQVQYDAITEAMRSLYA